MTPKTFLGLLPPLNTDKTLYLCMTCSGACMLTDSGPVVLDKYRWFPKEGGELLVLNDVLTNKNVWVSSINTVPREEEHPWWKDWRFTWIDQQWKMEKA